MAAHFDASGEFPFDTLRKAGELGFMGVEITEIYEGTSEIQRLVIARQETGLR